MNRLKIYFNNTPLILAEEKEIDLSEKGEPVIHFQKIHGGGLNKYLDQMWQPGAQSLTIVNENIQQLQNEIFQYFTIIKAAGGIVFNKNNELLLIKRLGKWDLPKGKLDEGENLQECALREVSEETNIHELSIIKEYGKTYHTYVHSGKKILKESHWFTMKYEGSEIPKPQAEEDITQVKWVPEKEIQNYASETYATIREILENIKKP